ncbi:MULTISPECIES: Ohr family peroxiredoxin [Burkholderia]|uniref:Ohr family peroxiredoxin n=1 Tax=Burkholderia TaxID=32008 RepID=UPI000B79C85C|nr:MULTISPECIES: Ohr family peroxiredoxin [Burkholderia]MBY4726269.1 Ohr family peroxiredoxin [Burkholderia contaminans]MCI3970504.1 Ohr family peroxiredoxin [Burkholderia sp. HI4860]MDN7792488.1 Ohr family peroxiredoxin [Burkholderia contaminans]OXJ04725.1 peroxiredoxin [Burkholderia sp. AU33647]
MQRTTRPSVSLLDPYTGSEPLPLYTTTVAVTGGESAHGRSSGHARSATGELDLPLRLPVELGGAGGGTNPEQLFAAGFAACFHGALTLVAMRRRVRLPTDLAISASATFQRDPSDGLFALELEVEVRMPGVDLDDVRILVAETEAVCPYAKMARDGIRHSVRVMGAG